MFENLAAGIQLAMTQPIKLGDVVVIKGEWGTIEEISTTLCRRSHLGRSALLIVPLSKLLQEPIENWTRRL